MLSVFLGLYSGASINIGIKMLSIPISIILGFMVGIVGFIIVHIFKKYQMRDTQKVLLVLALAVLISELEFQFKTKIEIASLLGVMTIGFIISEKCLILENA